ncbi:MAG: sulfatase [Pirellulaceae bacterium]|nr:MAG: sulfatase [Pirellulaceae bacterium]
MYSTRNWEAAVLAGSALREVEPGEAWHVQRRWFLRRTGFGLGALALRLLGDRPVAASDSPAADPLSAKAPHFPPKARHVIYLHMVGAPSQLDLFDYKPALKKYDGEPCPESVSKGRRFAFIGNNLTLAGSPFVFRRRGQCGQWISDLLPHLAEVADELAVVRSVHTEEINHAPAQMLLHTGFGRGGRPSFGAWVVYGLGSENDNLPAYVVLLSGPKGGAGTSLWSAGFLPSIYQGVEFRSARDPVLFLSNPPGFSMDDRRRVLDAVAALNQHRFQSAGDPEIITRIVQYEKAFRMQMSVPELVDLSRESPATLKMYGVEPGRPSFAANCLLARRLVEQGVRLVELYDSDWDHHNGLATRLPAKCRDVDQAMAALIKDLKHRGLLDQTLVIWGSEFGRTPLRQGADNPKAQPGRDHHKDAFTFWLAGGGVPGGVSVGKTDELGFDIVEEPVHVHDLNATVLHLLGLDHERLTYRYQGREHRLTDVGGHVVQALVG